MLVVPAQARGVYRDRPQGGTVGLVSTTAARPVPTLGPPARPRWFLGALQRPGQVLEHVTPNWFAAVMGTGIVANAAATLPWQPRGLHTAALVVWLLAAAALLALSTAFALHWVRHRDDARGHAAHPVTSQFYGAPPMALLTVGAGAQLLGHDLIGTGPALVGFAVLWTLGTATGLATSLWVPFRMITTHPKETATALPAWLMPVVPPMVSASTGALLVPHVPAGQARLTLLLGCYALFGLSLVIGMMTTTMIYSRLVHDGPPAVAAGPTVWITLGMVGQSITAVNLLGAEGGLVFSGDQASLATGLHVVGLVYGIAMGGFGALFFCLAVLLTVHAARRGLGFSLTWWSFTFPVGTCVTGATALGTTAGSAAVHGLAVALFVVLVAAWAVVATRTVRGSLRGELFLPA